METMFKGGMIKRFIVYPIIFTFIWTYTFKNFPDFFLMKLTLDNIKTTWINTIHLHVSLKTYVMVFGFLFGYVYGTISLFIKVREFKGLSMFVLFFIKSFISMILTCLFGFLYIIELCIRPFIIYLLRKRRNKRSDMKMQAFLADLEKIIIK